MSSSSSSFLDTHRSRPAHNMPSRLLSSLKRPFSKPKHDPYPSILPDRTREPSPGETPPSYEQIAMGLHLSRTPHIPAHLTHIYPPTLQPRLQRSASSPTSAPQRAHRARPTSAHLPSTQSQSQSRSHCSTPPRSPSRSYTPLPPPPARSAMKKPRTARTTATSSSLTPDSASTSTVASSVAPSTPTSSSARSGLLSRFLGKERGAAPALVSILAELESEPEPERKAVRFGGLEEES